MTEIENSLLYTVNKTAKMIFYAFSKSFATVGFDLTIEQFVVLISLSSNEACNQQDLANLLDKDKSAVLRNINVLERKNYVERIKDTEDKRRNIVVPTEKGRELVNQLIPYFSDFNKAFLSDIKPGEMETTKNVLLKLQDNIKCFTK